MEPAKFISFEGIGNILVQFDSVKTKPNQTKPHHETILKNQTFKTAVSWFSFGFQLRSKFNFLFFILKKNKDFPKMWKLGLEMKWLFLKNLIKFF